MTSTSNTMLVTCWRANTSRATSRRKPLNPHCVSCTGPDDPQRRQQVERLAEQPPPARAARRACRSRRAGSASRRRRRRSRAPRPASGSSSGGVAMSASAKTTTSPRRVEHAGPDRRALAAVRDGQQLELAVGRLRPGADEGRGAVGRAVVDHEHLDRSRAAPPRPGGRRAPRRRGGGGSRTARRARGRAGPPRCRRAGRWTGIAAGIAASLGGGGASCNRDRRATARVVPGSIRPAMSPQHETRDVVRPRRCLDRRWTRPPRTITVEIAPANGGTAHDPPQAPSIPPRRLRHAWPPL